MEHLFMMDAATWRKELFDEIRTIANRSDLEQLWSGKNPMAISSYDEEVAHVFDDYNIDGFIARCAASDWLSAAQLSALKTFRDEFASYVDFTNRTSEGKSDYRIILADPRWIRIMSLAEEFVSLIGQSTDRE
jgi:hypothetical protein